MKNTAGLLAYRHKEGNYEVFLVHPGGPFWAKKDLGSWSIPKGIVEDGEDLLEAAKREFREETGFDPVGNFVSLGSAKNKSAKVVHAWAFEADFDPRALKSNTTMIEWPPRSSKKLEIPEVDKGDYFDLKTAKDKITPYQIVFIEVLEKTIYQ